MDYPHDPYENKPFRDIPHFQTHPYITSYRIIYIIEEKERFIHIYIYDIKSPLNSTPDFSP